MLELGAGTGKLTRLLVDKFERLVAAEPSDAMRQLLVANCPRAEVSAAPAEQIPLPDAAVDAVFAAEAFHKFDGARAVDEIARVLKPHGTLVLMWNLPAGATEPTIDAAERFLEEHAPDRGEIGYDPLDLNTDRYASGEWRVPFGAAAFEAFREVRLPNPQTIDRDGLVAFFASMGWIGDLPDAQRLPLIDELRSLLPAATYVRQWQTHVHWTHLP